jgi:hypothetical protein
VVPDGIINAIQGVKATAMGHLPRKETLRNHWIKDRTTTMTPTHISEVTTASLPSDTQRRLESGVSSRRTWSEQTKGPWSSWRIVYVVFRG